MSCFHEVLRYLQKHRPESALFENVTAMATHVEQCKSGLDVLLQQTGELGYYSCVREICLASFHMAQRKRRECSVDHTNAEVRAKVLLGFRNWGG